MNDTISISGETVAIFKTLYEVDQSLRIDHSETEEVDGKIFTVLRSKSANNTTMAKVFVEEAFPRDVNIYDLREFISVLSIVDEPVLNMKNENYLMIQSTDKKQKLRYIEANPDLISSYSDKDPVLSNEDETITVTEQQFKSIMTAAQTLKFEYIGFVGNGENIFLTTFNRNEGDNQENNSYAIEIGETEKEFQLLYKNTLQNVFILGGEGDLMFTVDGSRKISRVDTATNKTYWISFDSSSEY